jgi:hypothetical protein
VRGNALLSSALIGIKSSAINMLDKKSFLNPAPSRLVQSTELSNFNQFKLKMFRIFGVP